MYIEKEKKPNKKIKIGSIIVILLLSYMLLYISYDAFKVRPEYNKKVDTVLSDFNGLKIYLDEKLPKMDSAIIMHKKQIKQQNKQLEELNSMTNALKDD